MKPYKPLLSQDNFDQIVRWLIEAAFKNDHDQLIADLFKHCKSETLKNFHHGYLLRKFLVHLKKSGPLPEITEPTFIKTLHDSILAYLLANPRLFEHDRSKAGKLVMGLRFLTVRAILVSRKHQTKDVERALSIYFHPDPSQKSDEAWKSYVSDHNLQVSVDSASYRAISYFKSRIRNVAEIKKKNDSSGALVVWDDIQPLVWTLLDLLDTSAPRTALDALVAGDSPFLDYVHRGAGDRSEETLVKFYRELRNLKTESEFWLSLKKCDIKKSFSAS